MKKPLQVRSKHEMQALDSICSQAMLALHQLVDTDKPAVSIDTEFLETLCQGYVMLYHKLMDHKLCQRQKINADSTKFITKNLVLSGAI